MSDSKRPRPRTTGLEPDGDGETGNGDVEDHLLGACTVLHGRDLGSEGDVRDRQRWWPWLIGSMVHRSDRWGSFTPQEPRGPPVLRGNHDLGPPPTLFIVHQGDIATVPVRQVLEHVRPVTLAPSTQDVPNGRSRLGNRTRRTAVHVLGELLDDEELVRPQRSRRGTGVW